MGNFLNLGAHVVDLFIVCDDRVNVDGCGAVQFILEFVLDIVNRLLDDQRVSMFPVLRRGRESVFRPVVVDDQVSACHGQGDGREQFLRFLLPDFSPEPDQGADRWYPS